MRPKFTDESRFKYGPYTPSGKTDVRKLFQKVRQEQAKIAEEQKVKVERLRKFK